MSDFAAVIKSLVGQVFVVSVDGLRRQVFEGDRIFAGEQITTANGGSVTLELANGETVSLGANSSWQAGNAQAQEIADSANQSGSSELEQALAAGLDPTTDLEPTAAGPGSAGGAGGAGGGHSAVMLTETAQRVDPTIGFQTAGPGTPGFNLIEDNEPALFTDSTLPATPNAPDNTAPVVTISIDPITGDDLLNSAELGAATVVVTGTVGGEAKVGDSITLNVGGTLFTGSVVDLGNGVLGFSIPVSAANLGAASSISATINSLDEAGNVGTAVDERPYTVDVTAPIITVAAPAVSNDTTPTITGTTDAPVGSTVTLTITQGNTVITVTTPVLAGGTYTVDVPQALAEGPYTVGAQVTDPAGNTGNATDSGVIDTIAGETGAAPIVTITEDINNDGVISKAELNGPIDVRVDLPAGAVLGDTLVITNGTAPQTITLTAAQIAAGFVTTTFANPGEGQTLTVDATLQDQFGNTSNKGTDSATVDTIAGDTGAAPIVTITEDSNNDGVISKAELNGDIDVSIKLPAGAVAGDTISITSGNVTKDIVLTTEQITAGQVGTTFPSPGEGQTITVDAVLKDQFGNTSNKGTDSATVDTLAGATGAAPIVTITEDTNNDGVISKAELNGPIDVRVDLPAGAVLGDTLVITNGTAPQTITLTAAQIAAGFVTTTFANPGEGQTLTVEATLQDQFGNTSNKGTDSATVDTLAGATGAAPTVEIREDINNDGVIGQNELSGAIDVRVGLPTGSVAGDTINVTDGATTQNIKLTANDITAGHVDTTFANPGEGKTVTVEATLQDQFGNTSGKGSDQALVNSNPVANDDPVGKIYTVKIGDLNEAGSQINNWTATDSNSQKTSIVAQNGNGESADLLQLTVDRNQNALGVGGTPRASGSPTPDQIEYDSLTGKSESITLSFSGNLNHADFTVSRLIPGEDGGEQGRWVALYQGVEVASGTFKNSGNGTGKFSIDTGNQVFDSIRFEAIPTVNNSNTPGDSSDYFLTGFSGTGPAAANGAYVINESQTLNINQTKGLLSNDSDSDAGQTLQVVQINGQNVPANGKVALATGMLTINADGSFSFAANDNNLKSGELKTQTFEYTISDGYGGTATAKATITIVGTEVVPSIASVIAATDTQGQQVDEGDLAVFTVKLTNSSSTSTTFDFALKSGTATAGSDFKTGSADLQFSNGVIYNSVTGKITVPAGVTEFTVGVPTIDDLQIEPNETFSLTIGGQSAQATIYDNDRGINIVGGSQFAVSEEGLAGGVPDSTGSSDTTNAVESSGAFSLNGSGVGAVWTLTAPPESLTSGGVPVTWSLSADGKTLTGSAGNAKVLTVTIDDSGAYKIVLSGKVDHPDTTAEDALQVNVGVQADVNGVTQSAKLPISIEDDAPVAHGGSITVTSPDAANVAPVASAAAGGNLLGIVGLSALNLIDLSTRSAFGATDVNNNISKVELNYSALVSLGGLLGAREFSISKALAAELGLNVEITNNSGILGLVGPSSHVVITSQDGGPIDNLAVNELLATARLGGGAITAEVLNATSITVTDTYGASSTASIGALADASVLSGTAANPYLKEGDDTSNTLTGTSGDDQLYGHGGNDTLNGGDGNDILRGGAGNDTLNGGAGNDILIGGTGNDMLTGGAGKDIFRWEKGDAGTAGNPAVDTVTDFTLGTDVLDLRSVLQGENQGNLSNYVRVTVDGSGNTVLHISSTGGFSNGYSAALEDQTIVLRGVNLQSAYGTTDSAKIVTNLVNSGNLAVDLKTIGVTGNVAPVAGVSSDGNLLGLVGLSALNLIDLSTRSAFGATDANNNISKVELSYKALLSLGARGFTYSAALANELGLSVVPVKNSGALGLINTSSGLTITSKDGGPIDNLAVNELLATVRLEGGVINAQVLNATSITVTDTYGASSSTSIGALADASVLSSTTANPNLKEGDNNGNTLTGTSGDDQLYGYGGNDILNGGDGNDILRGGAGNDTLNGGAGNDILIGGTGNDILTGGAGKDIFRWEKGDAGTAGKPAVDTVTDFTLGTDVLDLRAFLQGESLGNLSNYIRVTVDGSGNTVLHISSTGAFGNGYNAALEDQTIVLQGVNLQTAYGTNDSMQIVTKLVNSGNLAIDTAAYFTTTGNLGQFGGDGGHVQSIAVSGVTYTYNATAKSVSANGTSASVTGYSFDATSKQLTVTTTKGEAIVVNMETGGYHYSASRPLVAGENTNVGFTLVDNDGDTASSSLQFNGTGTPVVIGGAPDAADDSYSFTAGLKAEYYGYNDSSTGAGNNGANLTNLSQVRQFIDSHNPSATFNATKLDYGNLSNASGLGNGTNLQNFLGVNTTTGNGTKANSLSTDPGNTSDAIIKMSGYVNLAAGTYDFKVTADDGYSIRINGQVVAEFNNIQSTSTATGKSFTISAAQAGAQQIEIIYWDQGGDARLKVELGQGGTYKVVDSDMLYHVPATSSLVVESGDSLTIAGSTLLSNDKDPDGDALSIISVQNATNGTVSLNNGSVIFMPKEGFYGDASFQYTISDGKGGSDTATATLKVTKPADVIHLAGDGANDNGDNTVRGGNGNDVLLGDTGGTLTTLQPATNYNIALLVDTSGSMQGDRMSLTKNALSNFAKTLAGHDGVVNLTLVGFAGDVTLSAKVGDLQNGTKLDSLLADIQRLTANGGTNYEAAFKEASAWFDVQIAAGNTKAAGYENLTFFLSDGDPTFYYNGNTTTVSGNGSTTNDQVLLGSLDTFNVLAGKSAVQTIGIGSGVSQKNLSFFDNTTDAPAFSYLANGSGATLANFDNTTTGWNNLANWQTSGTGFSSGSVGRSGDALMIRDTVGGSPVTATTPSLTIADGAFSSLRFAYGTLDAGNGDSLSWKLQQLVQGVWTDIQTGGGTTGDYWTTAETSVVGAGTYRLAFSVDDKSANLASATMWIDNITRVDYTHVPVGKVEIVNSADELSAVLHGGSNANVPVKVGNDTLYGGDGDDIIFGDVINTDALPWGVNGNPTKPVDLQNGAGTHALETFLELKNGIAPSNADMYDYIRANHETFNVAGDTRGGSDHLYGGAGNDILYGQGGNDFLIGGAGDDILFGGAGADTFVWQKGDFGKDVIKDFSVAEGDTLDLSSLLQDHSNNLDGYLKLVTDNGSSTLLISTKGEFNNGDITTQQVAAKADVQIDLGHASLASYDINTLIANHTIKVDP